MRPFGSSTSTDRVGYTSCAATFVLDFQNSTEEIRDAFRPFYEATELNWCTRPGRAHNVVTARLRLRPVSGYCQV